MQVDLNCDLGESFGPWPMGQDAAMLDLVSSANVACGFHGGDPDIMRDTAALAKQKGVAIGAHPGFNDLQGFGRRRILGMSAREIEAMVAYQIGAMQACAALAGHRITCVKAHGALSNMGCEDAMIAGAIAAAIKGVDRTLAFVVLPLTQLQRAGEAAGLTVINEVFADRAYEEDGTLVSRAKPGAMIHDAALAGERVLRMVQEQAVTAITGKKLPMPIHTICIHGDNPAAVALGRQVRATLEGAGVAIKAFAPA